MTVSVVIPTLNRQDRLRSLVQTLTAGSIVPDEIVVVEQGDVEETRRSLTEFKIAKVFFQEEPSLAVARNRGIAESSGALLIFVDDDMTTGNTYVEESVRHFETHPETLGATGSFMRDEPVWTWRRVLGALFFVYSWSPRNVVLPSGSYDYIRGDALNSEQEVEWLYGGNMVVRRSVFERRFSFNPHFKRWSFGEDAMFSYQVHKAFPGSLRYLPQLSIAHGKGTENKMLNADALRMRVVYRYVFWYAEVYAGKTLHLLAYLWSQVGLSGLELMQRPTLQTLTVLLQSHSYLIKNHKAIAEGRLDYNQFVFRS